MIGVPDEEAGELPKAFVVPADDELDADELMAWVAEQVSPQKQHPPASRSIDEIPKSPSGKILRRVLVDRARARRLRPDRPHGYFFFLNFHSTLAGEGSTLPAASRARTA